MEWAAVAGASSYLLIAQDGDSFIETIITNSPGTVTGLKAATVYKISIRSINAGGRSQPSPAKKAKTGTFSSHLETETLLVLLQVPAMC